jgi:AraC-like DNA-binding protein
MDPLSDVLHAVRLTGAYFYFVDAASPWSVSVVRACDFTPRILPDTENLVPYHILTEGECWGGLIGGRQVRMQQGDILLFPHGDQHLLSSQPGHQVDSVVHTASPSLYPETMQLGDGAVDAKFLCGFLGWDSQPFNPLLASLPPVIHIPNTRTGFLARFPDQAIRESRTRRAGSFTMLTRMAELMFVEVLRLHLESVDDAPSGWLAGLRDPIVAAALALMHERPAHSWTLPLLAREVAASRSVLAERFAQVTGIPPMQYLAQWRLQLAADELSRGNAKVASVGARIGYDSEAAFSRAFKRATGESPSEWRKRRRQAQLSR